MPPYLEGNEAICSKEAAQQTAQFEMLCFSLDFDKTGMGVYFPEFISFIENKEH